MIVRVSEETVADGSDRAEVRRRHAIFLAVYDAMTQARGKPSAAGQPGAAGGQASRRMSR